MKLQNIFAKPVDRHIEGVIKADDEESLKLEIEEYVLTNQVAQRIEDFLEAYLNYQGANGVWLSGFFGSGKSHLLKMLALLLENRSIDGASALDLFLEKKEIQDNEIIRALLKRAVAIPSRSILFNIDQKADVISKTEIDALLSVFVKVFDESCGYYGKQGHIAQFERELDEEGRFQTFKEVFLKVSGKDWDFARRRSQRFASIIDQVYGEVTGQSTSNIIDRYKSDYKVSIEDFAELINDYVQSQGDNFRLNFFVDEVGQYIADNVKLMTNLQTISESLATKCHGRAWIIVTAQQDMDAVIGEGWQNDFSKIMARFHTKMGLTSANVDEVIQKRLLLKTESGVTILSDVYHEQSNNLKTLFDFADGAKHYKNFRDRDHFIHCYPFIPYQFTLFQGAIQSLSTHNAFEGKHSSVGERSMLGVFQQVAIQISDCEIGELATFDLMFEGLRSSIKSQIQQAIIVAEKNLDSTFAIKLLKALFLVKYVKDFRATVRNLCVLMLDSFDQDLTDLRDEVEAALNLLEQQTYIQRNGEEYEFLTDDEKDVEEEIKNTEVETSDVADELAKLIFDYTLKNRKIRYDDNGQDYPFSRKLDDHLHGRESELGIHVISPFHEHAGKEELMRMQSMGRDELLVVMDPDERLVRDLMMYKRTEKYVRQNVSVTQQDAVKRILTDKSFQNQERYRDLQQRVKSQLGKARLFTNGEDIELGGEEPIGKVTRGFYRLIETAYPNLRMLRGAAYSEADINGFLQEGEHGLFGDDAAVVSEAEQEVLSYIQTNSRSGVRTSLKSLVERFEKKPYGWYLAATLCIAAKLCARGKIEVSSDSQVLEDAALEKGLKNSHGYSQVILNPQVDFTPAQVRQLKDFYADFFDAPPAAGEAKALGKEVGVAFQERIQQIESLASQTTHYPFLTALTPVLDKINEISSKPYTWYLTELARQEDSLLDMKEQIIDPILKFMGGSQKEIFDNACKFVQFQEPNFVYIEGTETEQLVAKLTDPDCFKGNRIQQIKSLLDSLEKQVSIKLNEIRTDAISRFNAMQERMQSMDEYQQLPDAGKAELNRPYKELIDNVNKQQLIAVINDRLRYFEDQGYQQLLSKMVEMATPQRPEPSGQQDSYNDGSGRAQEDKVEYIHSRKLQVSYSKAWLADETDVDRYLESLRETLLKEIHKGKRVQI